MLYIPFLWKVQGSTILNEPFSNKRVWITGASSGIGAALALQFNKLGAHTILSARSADKLEQVKASCDNSEGKVVLLPFDLKNNYAVPDNAKKAERIFDGIDIVIANAGISQRSLFYETDFEVIDAILTTNLSSTLFLIRALLPGMRKQGSGTIGIVSSIVGRFGTPMRAVYSASKHGLHGFCESLAAEVYHDNISISLIIPGFVRTEISRHSLTGDGRTHGIMDANQSSGIAPEVCARRIVAGLRKKKKEIHVGLGGKGSASLFVHRFFPSLFRRIIRTAKVT